MRKFLLLFCFSIAIFAEEKIPYEQVVFGGAPGGVVAGCVDVITGNYVISETDWIVQGAEPIRIERRYLSKRAKEVFSGWEFFFKHLVAKRVLIGEKDEIHSNSDDTEHVTSNIYDLEVPEKEGFSLHYEGTFYVSGHQQGNYKIRDEYPHALTNCYGREVGARSCAFRNHVYNDPKEEREIIVEGGDGGKRIYKRFISGDENYYLIEEKLPNGNKIIYEWEQVHLHYRLSGIKTTNESGKKIYAWAHVHYHMDGEKYLKEVQITTSDHQTLRYKVKNVKGNRETYWVLDRIEHTGKPNESFGYWGNKNTRYYVTNRQFPEGRQLRVDYYSEGNHRMPREIIHIGKKDLKKMRVKQLNFPVGPGGMLNHLYAFYHHPGKYKSKRGSTTVIDYYGGTRRYFYNKDFLLDRIQYHQKDGSLFSTEEMEWKEYDKEKGRWLRSKTLKDGSGNPLRKIMYHYDQKGNVYLEELIGNHTGRGNVNERFQIHRKFNEHSLVTVESDSQGKKVAFQYVPGTDLVSHKFTYDREQLKIREFFIYEGAVLRKKIIDDGTGKNYDDLSNVSERLIMEFIPKASGEFVDLPEVVQAKYWDLESRCERLLYKRKIEKYNAHGMPEKVIYYDAEEIERYTLSYVYDASGRLISETDPIGRIHQFNYDANDNLIYEKVPDEIYGKTFSYDLMNHPTAIQEENRLTQQTFDFLGRKTHDIHFRKTVVEHQYDSYGHPVLDCFPLVQDEMEQSKHPNVKRVYNAMGKVAQETDPLGQITQTFYTCHGKPYLIIYPDGTREQYEYNLRGEVIKHIAPNQTETHEERDFLGRVIKKQIFDSARKLLSDEAFVYSAFHCIQSIAPNGIETHFFYDGAGRKIKESTLNRITTYEYDSLGREEKVIQNKERFFIKKYDLLNRVLEEREEDQSGTLFGITKYTYDDFSNKIATIKEVQVGQAIYRTLYDTFKREVKNVDPLGYETIIDYDDYYLNELGQKVLKKTTTNSKGTKTVEIFDALDRLVELQKLNPQGKLLLIEKFSYDLNGNKRKQQSLLDGKEIVKTWKYDSRGRLIETNESGEKVTAYTYTSDGHLETLTKPDGVVITYRYDGLGRQIEMKTSDESCHYSFKHDAMGNVIESKDEISGTITSRSYNHFGDLLHETLGNGISLSHSYDSLGRPVELFFQDQSKVKYDYDPYHLKSVKRLDSDGGEFYEHTYDEYDKSHNLLSEYYQDSIGPAYHQVDLLGRRIRTDTVYSSEIISEIDSTGNVTKYLRNHNTEQEVIEYTYDDLDQLTSETGPFPHSYSYDAHYNRLQKDEEQCEVDSLHQLLAQGEVNHTYDPNGNRTSTQKSPYEITYTYDGLDRLTHIRSGSKSVRLSYDSWGRCLSRTYSTLQEGEWNLTQTDYFLYDGQNELGIYPHELRILGQGKGAEIGSAIVIEKGKDIYVPIHDLFGNIIATMNGDGTCVESYRFSAYGEEKIYHQDITLTHSDVNPWRYQSKRKVGGLINFGRRFYDPESGRWLSPDPKGFNEGPNLYQYLRNSPLLNFDFYGLSVESEESYSARQFMKDVGYVYYYTVRRTLEGYATANPKMAFAPANLGQALGNVISGNYERPVSTRSEHIYLPGKRHPYVDTYFFNGMSNNRNNAIESAKFLQSTLNGYEVNLIFNNTHGAFDFLDFLAAKLNIPTGTSRLAYNVMDKQTISQNRIALAFAHSEGTGTSNSTFGQFSWEQRQNIDYIGIGSAQIHRNGFTGSGINSMSGNDLISFFGNPINSIGAAMFKDDHVQFLKPDSKTPWGDHAFLSSVNTPFIEKQSEIRIKKYNMN